MKIVHIIRMDKHGGGAENFAVDLADHFDASVIVLDKYTDKENIYKMYYGPFDKIRESVFSIFDKLLWKVGYHQSFKKAFFLHDACNNTYKRLKCMEVFNKADIVHLHNLHGGYFDVKAIKQIAKSKPIVWTLHDMWAVTGGEAYTIGNDNYKRGNPKTPHTNIYPLSEPYLIDLRGMFIRMKKRIYKSISNQLYIVPVCNWLEDVVKSSYVYNSKLNIVTIKNGINLSVFNNKKIKIWDKPRVLIHNSGNNFKGAEIFDKILNQFKLPIDLYVLGNPITIFENNITVTNLDYIESQDELASIFNQVDIMIHPSKAESYSLMILQAMACGVCVVGSEVGGTSELLSENRGVLFNRDNLDNLFLIQNDLISNIESTRLIGENASDWVLKNADFNKMVEEYHKLYKRTLNID